MDSTRSHGRGRGRENKPKSSLRKPGEYHDAKTSVSQDDEKPELAVNVTDETEQERREPDITQQRKPENLKQTDSQNSETVLQRAVHNPIFVPKQNQEPVRFNVAPSTSSSILASAVNAPEFVPGQSFCTQPETADKRLEIIETLVNNKMKQLIEDPGLLDELSMSMASYLSQHIKVERDMIRLSDLLFEKCVSEQTFQYTGSRLANYLDKHLIPKSSENLAFRTVFLNRCEKENKIFNELINTNPDRACSVAIFIGELLMNYKTNEGETIKKFLVVIPNIIKQLLGCTGRKFLICAGQLLKLTGSLLDPKDELFVQVTKLASDPRIDKTAQMLFSRVCELRNTSWGQDEVPKTPTHTQPNPFATQTHSIYLLNMDGMFEEQAPDLPVCVEEEWNEYDTGDSSLDSSQGDVTSEINEDLYRQMHLEQYGTQYVPFGPTANWSEAEDDYDADYIKFLEEKQ